MSPIAQSAVLLLIVAVNGFLALSEMALISARKVRLQKFADDGHLGATKALLLANSPTRFLASLQICITILGIAAGAWGGANLSSGVEAWIANTAPRLAQWSHGLGVGLVVAVETFLMVLLGELLPKRIALFFPERIAMFVAPSIDRVGIAISPAANILSRITDQIIKTIPYKPNLKEESESTEDEIKIMVEQGADAGVFDKTEESMLKRALEFGDLSGADVMTPRTRIISFNSEEIVESVIDRMLSSGYSNYPLYGPQREVIVGVVSIKRAFAALRLNPRTKLSEIATAAVFLPDSAKAGRIFETMRAKRKHIVVLIDEFGGVAGLVTATDLMEAVVGEVPGGHVKDTPKFIERADGTWLVDGMVTLTDLTQELDFAVPDEVADNYQTLSGLVMHYSASIPREGQVIEIPEWRFEVVDMDRNRIDKVLVTRVVERIQTENMEEGDYEDTRC